MSWLHNCTTLVMCLSKFNWLWKVTSSMRSDFEQGPTVLAKWSSRGWHVRDWTIWTHISGIQACFLDACLYPDRWPTSHLTVWWSMVQASGRLASGHVCLKLKMTKYIYMSFLASYIIHIHFILYSGDLWHETMLASGCSHMHRTHVELAYLWFTTHHCNKFHQFKTNWKFFTWFNSWWFVITFQFRISFYK